MTLDEFAKILHKPSEITASQTHELDNIVEEFPYFQAARVLQLKVMHNQGNYRYNKALKKAAVHVADRSVLYDFIHEVPQKNHHSEIVKTAVKKAEKTIAAPLSGLAEVIHPTPISAAPVQPELPPKLYKRATYYDEPNGGSEAPTPFGLSERNEISEKRTAEAQQTDSLYSFTQWLKNISANTATTFSSEEKKEATSEKFKLIDRFLETNPKIETKSIEQINFDTPNVNLAEKSTAAPQQLMTETLAQIYAKQKKYKLAIQAYEILILKNPEKSGYFADQINNIKNLQQNN